MLDKETAKISNYFLPKGKDGDPSILQMNDIPKVEDISQLQIFLYDVDFVDEDFIVELARISIQKYDKIVKLLRYNNHICYITNINTLFKAFRCSTCDTFLTELAI